MKTGVWAKAKIAILFCGLIFVFAQIFSVDLHAQKTRKAPPRTAKKKPATKAATVQSNLPKVTQIDAAGLKNLLKRDGAANPRPLLINFWATWCEPCREEFPDLVKIDRDYKGKINFITISLDYLSEIKRDVPKFLAQMKAEMPAYLLKTDDESAAIALVSKDWQGALPFTILFDASGKEVYVRQGKINLETVRGEIDKMVVPSVENKSNAKISFGTEKIDQTSDSKGFNRQPFNDFGARLKDAILKNEVNTDAPFDLEVTAGLDKNGRLINAVVSVKPGSDEKMSELAKEFISACGDSEIFRPLYDLGNRQINIKLAQDEKNLNGIIQSETESESRTKTVVSALNMFLKMSRVTEGSDEAILLGKTQVSGEGKSLIINFSISHEEKNQLLQKSLKRLQ